MCRIPDSRLLLLAASCITGEYRYRPVLRVSIPIFSKRPHSTDHGRRQNKQCLCVLTLVPDYTSIWARQIHTPTLPPAEDTALGRNTVFVTINNGTSSKMSYWHTPNFQCMYRFINTYIRHFFHVSTVQTTQPILTHDSLNNAFRAIKCLLGSV